jgi:hypothetical protein
MRRVLKFFDMFPWIFVGRMRRPWCYIAKSLGMTTIEFICTAQNKNHFHSSNSIYFISCKVCQSMVRSLVQFEHGDGIIIYLFIYLLFKLNI